MLMILKKWWNQEDVCTKEPALELAMTKLMVGMMAMDGVLHESQHGKIEHLLETRFGLSSSESAKLIEQSLDQDASELNFRNIVKYIESNYNIDERVQILSHIWSVAIVDGNIDFLEEQYINRLAGLISVPTKRLKALKSEQEKAFTEAHDIELSSTVV